MVVSTPVSRRTSSVGSCSIATALFDGFTKRYNIKRLVWYEMGDAMDAAIATENASKNGRATGRRT
jgi:predicted GIY-YIG superfamily endonuclease